MEAPAQDGGLEDGEEKSDTYGSLLTSDDNPWKLDTVGMFQQETLSSLDNGNFYCKMFALFCQTSLSEVLCRQWYRMRVVIIIIPNFSHDLSLILGDKFLLKKYSSTMKSFINQIKSFINLIGPLCT